MNLKKNTFAFMFLLIVVSAPAFANASWWNPVSWFSFLFNRKAETVIVATTTVPVVTETIPTTPAETTSNVQDVDVPKTRSTNEGSVEIKKIEAQRKLLEAQNAALKLQMAQQKTTQEADQKVTIPTPTIVSTPAPSNKDFLAVYSRYNDLRIKIVALAGPTGGAIGTKMNTTLSSIDKDEAAIDSIVRQGNGTQSQLNAFEANLNIYSSDFMAAAAVAKTASIQAETQAITQASTEKQAKLNAINQQIAALNTKYTQDIENVSKGGAGGDGDFSETIKAHITDQYILDYNKLKAQWQTIYYGN